MGSLPPSSAREFETAIMVPARAGSYTWLVGPIPIEGLKGEPWSAQQKQHQKQELLLRGKSKATPNLSSQPTCALTTPISSYTVKSSYRKERKEVEGRKEDQTAPLPAVAAWASRQR